MALKLGNTYKFNSGFKLYRSETARRPFGVGNGRIIDLDLVDKPEPLPPKVEVVLKRSDVSSKAA